MRTTVNHASGGPTLTLAGEGGMEPGAPKKKVVALFFGLLSTWPGEKKLLSTATWPGEKKLGLFFGLLSTFSLVYLEKSYFLLGLEKKKAWSFFLVYFLAWLLGLVFFWFTFYF